MEERTRGHAAPIAGIILLFVGAVLLLETMGYLSWELWQHLWRFWPVIIVIAGLNILLRNVNAWVRSLLILLILGGCFATAIYQSGGLSPREVMTITTMLGL